MRPNLLTPGRNTRGKSGRVCSANLGCGERKPDRGVLRQVRKVQSQQKLNTSTNHTMAALEAHWACGLARLLPEFSRMAI